MLAGAPRLSGAPLIRLRCAQAPSPTGGEGGHRVTATPITTVRDWLKRCYRASPSPRVGEGGRAGAKRRRGRMRGAGRSAAGQAGKPLSVPHSSNGMKKTKILYPRPFGLSHNPGIALTGTWCAPGIREGGGAGPVAWRKRGWKFSSEARARFAAPPHRQRPPRGPRRSGKTTGGALGRRHTFTLRGTDPAPRFPTAPDKESSLTIARPETGRGDEEAYLPVSRAPKKRSLMESNHPATGKAR